MTNLPVRSLEDALEKIKWYGLRWKIETFHKILKSGCRAEQSKLRTTERLTKLVAVFCILSWRIFWMTMVARINPVEKPETVLTKTEMALLDKLTGTCEENKIDRPSAGKYLLKIARLGGYLARASDPPPGNMVMWRGVSASPISTWGSCSRREMWVIERLRVSLTMQRLELSFLAKLASSQRSPIIDGQPAVLEILVIEANQRLHAKAKNSQQCCLQFRFVFGGKWRGILIAAHAVRRFHLKSNIAMCFLRRQSRCEFSGYKKHP